MPANATPAKPRFYDFFAGAGLVELALQDSWNCAWANDIDQRKAVVHALNFDHSTYVTGDVAAVDAAALPQPAAMAWASFPCQDLSLAGWRRGMSASRSGAYWAFWRLMHDLHESGAMPPIIVLENVVGLLHGESFPALCESLAALDLQFGAMVINANRFVPQSRPRVFLVAIKDAADASHLLHDSPMDSGWFPKRVHAAYNRLTPELQLRWRWWSLAEATENVPPVASLIESEPTGVEWDSQAHTKRLLSMMSPANLKKIDAASEKDGPQVGFLYRRTRQGQQRAEVRFDGVAGCLRTPYGGSSRQTVVIVNGTTVRSRLLSPREAARLMGAGDDFALPPAYNDAYRAMGDAVAVPAVRWLSDHLLLNLVDVVNASSHAQTSTTTINRHRAIAEGMAREWSQSANQQPPQPSLLRR